ncbi:MAG: Rrf2 family transcriptional regulator [Candidatus Omnitrophica bacterium]|nr:Rrf2 family transcriptional regulator [Candidatus Omnitrophota bacterium]
MRISARCEYACRALVALSLHWPSKSPLRVGDIAREQDIPMRYLVQILIQLKRRGLVSSARGKEGGYNLAIPPHEISLGKVVREMSGPFVTVPDGKMRQGDKDLFWHIWSDVERAMSAVLDEVTFDDICQKARGVELSISYQI